MGTTRILGGWMAWLGLASFALGAEVPRPEHPEPQAVRAHWANLNGDWQFRFDPSDEGVKAAWFQPDAAGFDQKITVPFGWESKLSGIERTDYRGVGWYRRTFAVPADFPKEERVWLHFGAVDWRADVWVNGRKVAEHEGGYSPFSADVTEAIQAGADNVLTVRAFDPTDPYLPTGKQVRWYTPTSGIWQTVWLESRPKAHIRAFTIRTEIDPARVHIDCEVAGAADGAYTLSAHSTDMSVAAATATAAQVLPRPAETALGALAPQLALDLNVATPKLWTPESPTLYDLELELKGPGGEIDRVKTYFGLRSIARGRYGAATFERILLNGKPIYLRGALDQSFNPEGIYTAPTDAFLKRDIELAKSFGLNMLRIHIKPDEPRRLYWADRLGMLIMQDMPNTWENSHKAQAAWEATTRESVARDRNHPAIIAWVAFNETWGLGRPAAYKADKETQQWVRTMVGALRSLDATRLIEDNSPCNYDHVETTDLNTWHFYIDDPAAARRHIQEVVEKTEPGSGFNYCPGLTQSTAPLINSEFGNVSAGGGDRDVSWGFRDLVTQLRRQPKIQGYIYTELSDIEWEHNGFLNYDRTAKEFGYDAFVPGMTVASLQGEDFIGYDGPPAVMAKAEETIRVPLFVSHFSERKEPPRLRWWVSGVDGDGQEVKIPPRFREGVEWEPYWVKEQKSVAFQIKPGPFVGSVGLSLEDSSGAVLATNFVNVVVRAERPPARVEWRGPHEVALRFAPEDYAARHWSGGLGQSQARGKAAGRGKGYFEYRLKLPTLVAKALPSTIELLIEASARADRERVDWPQRRNAQDNPQTDVRRWPSTLELAINGRPLARADLPDDPADSRGVLSHMARADHGSYGELLRIQAELPDNLRDELAAGKPLVIRLGVPEGAAAAGGLCLFGAETGRFPFDPTLVIGTLKILPKDLGAPRDQPVTIDTLASRQKALIVAGDSTSAAGSAWSYTTNKPDTSWMQPDFDSSSWPRAAGGFGTPGTPALKAATRWETPQIWIRTTFDLPQLGPDDSLALRLFHDEDVEIFVNGKPLHRARGYVTTYADIPLTEAQRALFKTGANVIAATCRQTGGGQGIDIGLMWTPGK